MAPLGSFGGADPIVHPVSGGTGGEASGYLMQAARDLLNPSPEGNPAGAEQLQMFLYICLITNSANISIPDNTATILTYDTNILDPSNMHSTSTNTSRITIPIAGRYLLFANSRYAAGATGYRSQTLLINGATVGVESFLPAVPTGGIGTEWPVFFVRQMVANDYVENRVQHNQGAALNIQTEGNFTPVMGCARLP